MSPKDFDSCVSGGGRVRTKSIKGGRYMKICFKDGKSHAGEVMMSKDMEKKSKEMMK